jgi:hypothetical protein
MGGRKYAYGHVGRAILPWVASLKTKELGRSHSVGPALVRAAKIRTTMGRLPGSLFRLAELLRSSVV